MQLNIFVFLLSPVMKCQDKRVSLLVPKPTDRIWGISHFKHATSSPVIVPKWQLFFQSQLWDSYKKVKRWKRKSLSFFHDEHHCYSIRVQFNSALCFCSETKLWRIIFLPFLCPWSVVCLKFTILPFIAIKTRKIWLFLIEVWLSHLTSFKLFKFSVHQIHQVVGVNEG